MSAMHLISNAINNNNDVDDDDDDDINGAVIAFKIACTIASKCRCCRQCQLDIGAMLLLQWLQHFL
jgi:hypothetical protein